MCMGHQSNFRRAFEFHFPCYASSHCSFGKDGDVAHSGVTIAALEIKTKEDIDFSHYFLIAIILIQSKERSLGFPNLVLAQT